MKNNLTFYRHDVGSHNHWKFKTLRRKYKWCGEGKFWALNNMIAASEGCRIHIDDPDVRQGMAAELDFDIEEFDEFLAYLVKPCKLVILEDGYITTGMVQEVFDGVSSKRERQREWKKEKATANNEKSTSTNQQSTAKNEESTVDFEQNKVEQSKVDKSKVNNTDLSTTTQVQSPAAPAVPEVKKRKIKTRREFVAPSYPELTDYFILKISKEWGEAEARRQASSCFDHYEANGWVQSSGQKLVDWKATARQWIRRRLSGDFSDRPIVQKKSDPPKTPVTNAPQPRPVEPVITEEQKQQKARDFVEDVYADFLTNDLKKVEMVSVAAYDILKKEGKMRNDLLDPVKIALAAKEKRLAELRASDNPTDKRLLKDLLEHPEQMQQDSGYSRHAKSMALLEFFSQLKSQNLKRIFSAS